MKNDKKYAQKNEIKIKEYQKKYRQANKEIKACDVCGKLYVNKTNHNITKFHTNAIKNKL